MDRALKIKGPFIVEGRPKSGFLDPFSLSCPGLTPGHVSKPTFSQLSQLVTHRKFASLIRGFSLPAEGWGVYKQFVSVFQSVCPKKVLKDSVSDSSDSSGHTLFLDEIFELDVFDFENFFELELELELDLN